MYSICYPAAEGADLATLQNVINDRQEVFHGKLIALCTAFNKKQCLIILQKTGSPEPAISLALIAKPDEPVPAGKTLICTGFIYIGNEQQFVAAYR